MTQKILLSSFIALFAFTLAAPALAEDNENATTTPRATRSTVDLVCMQTAVAKRDNAILSALGTYNTSWNASLTKRRDALVTAWQLTEKKERKTALNNAWSTYRREKLAAWKQYAGDRLSTWKTYRTERKACGTKAASEDTSSSDLSERSED